MGADVIVYYITGKQLGPLSVPDSWCEECDLTVRAVRTALDEADAAGHLVFETKPWFRHMFPALLRGGWHPPVVVLDGSVYAQGVVPEIEPLCQALSDLAAKKQAGASGAVES